MQNMAERLPSATLQKNIEWKKPDTNRIHVIWFHLYDVQKQAELICAVGTEVPGYPGVENTVTEGIEHAEGPGGWWRSVSRTRDRCHPFVQFVGINCSVRVGVHSAVVCCTGLTQLQSVRLV